MSTIRKTPYIESAVALLSDEQKSALLTALNTATPVTTQANFKSFTEGINAVIFTLPNGVIKTGILINITGLELLIAYQTNEQTLELIALNSTNETFSKIDEYCDINELRRVLADSQPSGTQVEANPDGEATAELETIGIDGTIYSVSGGGGTLYQHNMLVYSGTGSGANYQLSYRVSFTIISSSQEKIDTISKLKEFYESVVTDTPANYSTFKISATGIIRQNNVWYQVTSIGQFTIIQNLPACYIDSINTSNTKNPLQSIWVTNISVTDMVIKIQ